MKTRGDDEMVCEREKKCVEENYMKIASCSDRQ